ncbi:uncharacterized protein KY384_007252 [Bacidia gigantensis]|uniref:uncharacterized protein n=1 Tax=Bacidia gigantensis TaxID=2732470 RepID=UPI001D0579D6|nr:uncharacterized protein KY384_007252 [Bacidia gigantensis]KAG8528334.1 hypothetical protein KY384_007252 [Bacidia gigantensis]
MPTQTLSRSPPSHHPRAMATGKSPSKIPIAYPAPYKHVTSTTTPRMGGSSANTSAVPSLMSDNGSSGRGGSCDGGMSDVDLLDMLDINLSHKINPEPLDRGMVRQAQASGELRAKKAELEELRATAQRRLKGARANFAEGAKAAKEVKRDLEWTQKKVK